MKPQVPLFELPDNVRSVSRTLAFRLGQETYHKPFRIASLLRGYGVRALSEMGPRADEALRDLVVHRDPQVRTTVAQELARRDDTTALDALAFQLSHERIPAVQDALGNAILELRRSVERTALETAPPEVPMIESGEDSLAYRVQ